MRKYLMIGTLLGACGLTTLQACARSLQSGPQPTTLKLDRVVLYQNGIGYFERHGVVNGEVATMMFAPYEVNDVLKTVTVIDANGDSLATVTVGATAKGATQVPVQLRLSTRGNHQLNVNYAVPTPTWKATYRVVLDEEKRSAHSKNNDNNKGLLQGWATINNTSGENWTNVRLALATGAPMSYAMDLKSPRYVSRPDVTGAMIEPVVTDAVRADVTAASAGDPDGDGIIGSADSCPNDAEDVDKFEDTDGCPDLDNDNDRIADAQDKCPDLPEVYNGADDDDGCPDKGLVRIAENELQILETIYFNRGNAALSASSLDVLDAVAAVLRANPGVQLVELQGFTSDDEANPWQLATDRANSVARYLKHHGVAPERLAAQSYGNTQPKRNGTSESAREANRRVQFLVLKRLLDDDAATTSKKPTLGNGAITAATLGRTKADTSPVDIAGASRYDFAQPITIPRGGVSMVAIINQPVDAEEVYLYRPDVAARGSDQHPFRAMRLHNSTSFTLQPGAVAIFARNTYVGDSLLSAMAPSETAFAPYTVDASTLVTVQEEQNELPLRIVEASRGAITLESASRQLTTYSIAPSPNPPARIYIRHAKHAGYQAQGLPPGAIDQTDAWLLPVPLSASTISKFVVEERVPTRRVYHIESDQLPDLAIYLANSNIYAPAVESLRKALAQRNEVNRLSTELNGLNRTYLEQLDRTADIRASLTALGNSSEGAALRKKLVADLAAITAGNTASAVIIADKSRALVAAQALLRDLLRDVVIAPTK